MASAKGLAGTVATLLAHGADAALTDTVRARVDACMHVVVGTYIACRPSLCDAEILLLCTHVMPMIIDVTS